MTTLMPSAGRAPAATAAAPARVVYVSATDETSGADRSLWELVRSLDPARYEPHVVLPHEGPFSARYRERGVAVHHVPLHKLKCTLDPRWHLAWLARAPARVARLGRLLAELQPEVVHVNASIEILAGLAARRHAGAALIWHVREAALRPPAVERAITALVHRWADAVIAISSPIAQRFSQHPRCRVIPNGLDLDRLPPRTRPPNATEPVLGWLGRLAPGKGIDAAITVFERIADERPGARLLVIGATVKGHERFAARVRRRLRQSRHTKRIAFCPGTDTPERAYAEIDLLLHLPERPEGLGRTVLEAQAVGTPVLSWPHGGLVDAVHDGVGGALARVHDLDDAVATGHRMLAEDTLAALSGRGRRFAQAFAAETVARHVAALYDEVRRR